VPAPRRETSAAQYVHASPKEWIRVSPVCRNDSSILLKSVDLTIIGVTDVTRFEVVEHLSRATEVEP
jgi:hypothetical protein